MNRLLEKAYLAGFMASDEFHNWEYPYTEKDQNPEEDVVWVLNRDNALEALRSANTLDGK